jgi:uncharacterized membrane protein YqaE (UPF0057 family)
MRGLPRLVIQLFIEEPSSVTRSIRSPVVKWILAIFLPPLAVLIWGTFLSAVINLILTLFFWIPGVIHAIAVINDQDAKRRHGELLKKMET